MTTPRISTGRERRVHQAMLNPLGRKPTFSVFGEPWHEDRRTGTDRRVASYRYFAQMLLREEEHTIHAPVVEDLILALRKPERVASEKAFEEACADTEDCDNQSQPGSSTPTCATCGYGCHRGQERRLRDVLVCRACACPSCRPAADAAKRLLAATEGK